MAGSGSRRGRRGVLGALAVWTVALGVFAEPVIPAEAEPEEPTRVLQEPPPPDLDRDQEAVAAAERRVERMADTEAAPVPLPPGATDGIAGPNLDGAREDPSILRDRDGDGDVEIPAIPAAVAADNVAPVITRATPAGLVVVRNPRLLVTGKNPDGIPTGGLEYLFKICEDEAMSVACVQTAWQSSNRWSPTHLYWARTYYWNVAVRETGAGGLTTEPTWKVPVTPTIVQPPREGHFGEDPFVEPHEGVNPSIGNYVASFTDVQVAAAGLPVELTRTYNSMDERIGVFGKGWSSFLDISAKSEAGAKMLVSFPDGRQERYSQNPDNSWASPPVSASVLTNRGSGFDLRRPDQMVYEFNGLGTVGAIRDGWGNKLTIARDGSGRATRVTNSPSGRYLDLTWAAQGPAGAYVITTVKTNPAATGQAAPTWTYRYDTGRLVEVCAPGEPVSGAACTTYSYFTSGRGSDGKLQRVKTPEGNDDVELSYAGNGTVAWVENGTNDRWAFTDSDDKAEGTYHPIDGWTAATDVVVDPGATALVKLTGGGGVPDTGVQAVVVNVDVASWGAGWLAAYPAGTAEPPEVSTMDFTPGHRATLHTVAIGTDGKIAMTNHGSQAGISFYVVGWYSTGGAANGTVFVPVRTTQILDTQQSGGKLADGEARAVQVTGVGGVPTEGVRAVVFDLEMVEAAGPTLLASWASDAPFPWISTARSDQAVKVDNLQISKVGADGKIQIYSQKAVHLRVNIVGFFGDPDYHQGSVFRPLTNYRLLDSRDPNAEWNTPWPAGQARSITVPGAGPIPPQGVTGVVGDVQSLARVFNPMRTSASGTDTTGNTYLAQPNSYAGNEPPWVRWRLGLLDSNQLLLTVVGLELGGWEVAQ
jgi:hypothetical protein